MSSFNCYRHFVSPDSQWDIKLLARMHHRFFSRLAGYAYEGLAGITGEPRI